MKTGLPVKVSPKRDSLNKIPFMASTQELPIWRSDRSSPPNIRRRRSEEGVFIVRCGRRVTGVVALCLLVVLTGFAGVAAAKSDLSEIDVAADMKRVAIKFNDKVAAYHDSMLSGPTCLVIDIPDIGISNPTISGLPAECGFAVRTAKTQKGGRVVLDFGRVQAPK